MSKIKNPSSFTLVELLVVIGILAILTAAVVVVINPAEYLRASRDVKRMADLASMDKALVVLETQGVTDFGSANVVYISIPDSDSGCANLGLPTLPSDWTYKCSSTNNYTKIDGTGWIPVNFQSSIALGFSNLPLDPINETSTGNYYSYVTGGSWELGSAMESTKYKLGGGKDRTSTDGGKFIGLYETGSNKSILPIDYGDPTLVGYWAFDEGADVSAYDLSGNGNVGTLNNGPSWTTGRVGGALSFDGSDDYVNIPHSSSLIVASAMTIEVWVNATSPGTLGIISKTADNMPAPFDIYYNNEDFISFILGDGNSNSGIVDAGILFETWQHWAFVYDGNDFMIYRDGILVADPIDADVDVGDTGQEIKIGNRNDFATPMYGMIDDVRIYNRVLTTEEITATYNSFK